MQSFNNCSIVGALSGILAVELPWKFARDAVTKKQNLQAPNVDPDSRDFS